MSNKKDDIDQFMDNGIYLPTRTIYMGSSYYLEDDESGVDFDMAERVIKAIHILDNQNNDAKQGNSPITILMNNVGGDIYHGLAIYDAIANCKNHVTVKVYGHAMSMGSWILQAADQRIMSKNSKIMIHYGYSSASTNARNFMKWSKEYDILTKMMEDVFLEKMNGIEITQQEFFKLLGREDKLKGRHKNKAIQIDREAVERLLEFDTFMNAEMSLKLNLIDNIE